MDPAFAWQQLFESWPSDAPRTGIIVTTFQETIGFTNFMTGDGLLAVERDRPDSLGARKVLIAFTAISAVKMTDTGDFSKIAKLGFNEPAGA
jgi:hypothetical protein